MLAALPPSSRVNFFFVPGDRAGQHLADSGRAGECDLVDVRMIDQGLAGVCPAPGDEY